MSPIEFATRYTGPTEGRAERKASAVTQVADDMEKYCDAELWYAIRAYVDEFGDYAKAAVVSAIFLGGPALREHLMADLRPFVEDVALDKLDRENQRYDLED